MHFLCFVIAIIAESRFAHSLSTSLAEIIRYAVVGIASTVPSEIERRIKQRRDL